MEAPIFGRRRFPNSMIGLMTCGAPVPRATPLPPFEPATSSTGCTRRSEKGLIRLKLTKAGRVFGYAVLQDEQSLPSETLGEMRVGTIVDVLARPEDAESVMWLAAQALEKPQGGPPDLESEPSGMGRRSSEGGIHRGPLELSLRNARGRSRITFCRSTRRDGVSPQPGRWRLAMGTQPENHGGSIMILPGCPSRFTPPARHIGARGLRLIAARFATCPGGARRAGCEGISGLHR